MVDKQGKWFIDKSSEKIYKVVWISERAVLLESEDSVQILTSTQILKTYYKPLKTIVSVTPLFSSQNTPRREIHPDNP